MVGVERQAAVVQKFSNAAGSLLAGRGVGEPANEGDLAAAVAVEMLGSRVPAIAVLCAYIIDIQAVQAPGQQHQRRAEQVRKVTGGRAMRRYQHNAVHIALDQRFDQTILQSAVLIADCQ